LADKWNSKLEQYIIDHHEVGNRPDIIEYSWLKGFWCAGEIVKYAHQQISQCQQQIKSELLCIKGCFHFVQEDKYQQFFFVT
jgi:hypothetical protein